MDRVLSGKLERALLQPIPFVSLQIDRCPGLLS